MERSCRTILHVDLDAFFAQAEVLAAPALRGKPLIVGGIPGQRGVVATASYEARRYGIGSGMALTEAARRCPHAVFLPCHPPRYLDLSARTLKILLERTPLVEMGSIDEASLDVTRLLAGTEANVRLARSIQRELLARLSLSASVGVGPNKLIAKMASGIQKPAGVTVLDRSGFCRHFHPQPVTALYGVGTATAGALRRLGIVRIGQLAAAPASKLRRILGIWGPILGAAARGEDSSPVVPHHETPEAKSLGHEYTLAMDTADRGLLRRVLLGICDEAASDLRSEGKVGETVHLKVRRHDFRTLFRQTRLGEPTASTQRIFHAAWAMLTRCLDNQPVRLLGVSISGLSPERGGSSADLFDDGRLDALDRAADSIRRRYGRRTLRRASLLPEEDR